MPSVNVVNLDALIRREDLAAPGEAAEDITSLPVTALAPKGMLYPALRKPDFQRETANWTPEQVSDLIATFARRDLIPAVILWRAGQNVFVIDGAHRLSALIAWVHDDYGDGDVSRKFFHNYIPPEQERAAKRTRDLVKASVGSYLDHQIAIEHPEAARPDIAARAARIAWQDIQAQWIRNADHDKAEKSFFRINQGGTKIDTTERRILGSRRSATALAARAILRAGTGHNYWEKFNPEAQKEIELIGGEIYRLLFEPALTLPIKTLDVPVAGHGYGPQVLPFLFDLINLVNEVSVPDSSRKNLIKEDLLPPDEDGAETIQYLKKVRATIWRICSNHASSLGLHPALYFYSATGVFQSTALLHFVELFRTYDTRQFFEFCKIRSQFESFLITHRSITEAVRKLGSGRRSRPRVLSLYRKIFAGLQGGQTVNDLIGELKNLKEFDFLFVSGDLDLGAQEEGSDFPREIKGGAYLRDALPTAPKCPVCAGLMHHNGMQTGHLVHKRAGGPGTLSNAVMQHPFCNSTVQQ